MLEQGAAICYCLALDRKPRMTFTALVFLALAMSTDAFAAAVGKGTALQHPRWGEALRTGVIFGCIEAVTPLVGWLIDRFGPRWPAIGGALGLALGFALLGTAVHSVPAYLLVMTSIGFIAAASSPVAHTRAVNAVFV